MLYKETVETGTLDLIKSLSGDKELKNLVLVGGTALSLQIGHRISVDIDLFSNEKINSEKIAAHLQKSYGADSMQLIKNGVFCFINDIKIDVISHQYKWIKPALNLENIRLASLEDIAAMKLNAITGNGTRLKDFIDIYFLLEHKSLQQMTNAFESKYANLNSSIAKNALLFHDEIKFENKAKLLQGDIEWEEVAKRLREAAVYPQKIFTSLSIQPALTNDESFENQLKKKTSKGLSKRNKRNGLKP